MLKGHFWTGVDSCSVVLTFKHKDRFVLKNITQNFIYFNSQFLIIGHTGAQKMTIKGASS